MKNNIVMVIYKKKNEHYMDEEKEYDEGYMVEHECDDNMFLFVVV